MPSTQELENSQPKSGEAPTPATALTEPPTEEKKVMVNESTLKELMDKVQALEEGRPPKLKKIEENKVFIRQHKGKYIVGWTKQGAYLAWNDRIREMELYIDVILEGEKTPETMTHKQFREGTTRIAAKIVSTKSKEATEEHGYVTKKQFDGRYSMVESDVLVPVEVTTINREFVVEFPDGKQLTIGDTYVNA